MAIPTVFQPVLKQDFTLNPIQVNKRFVIGSSSYATTGSGYRRWDACYKGDHLRIGDPNASNYATNSIDGSYKNIIWKSIDSQYYRFPYDSCATLEHANSRYTYKYLGISASILSIPQHDFGESIKPGSVEITASGDSFYLQDDGNGNLYDPSISTASYADRTKLVGRWSFDETFRNSKNLSIDSNTGRMASDKISGKYLFSSNVIQPGPCSYNQVKFSEGIAAPAAACGQRIYFQPGFNSYVHTEHFPELNFPAGDFTIAFWMNVLNGFPGNPDSQILINKSEVGRKILSGHINAVNSNNQQYLNTLEGYSSSIENKSNPVYPYRFEYSTSGEMFTFKRTDGINTVELTANHSPEDAFHHYSVVKSGSRVSLYKDGSLVVTGSDSTLNPYNSNDLIFGSRNLSEVLDSTSVGFELDEVRFYEKGLSASEISELSTLSQDLVQTAIVGNIFYKTGLIVVSPFDQTYLNPFAGNPTVKWKSTHTIYEYEILCRVKKSFGNLTLNPSARKYPGSDLLIDDFTGSLDTQYELSPYITGIGLYNDNFELVAVAKLGQAIKTRSDVDLNFLVKIDA